MKQKTKLHLSGKIPRLLYTLSLTLSLSPLYTFSMVYEQCFGVDKNNYGCGKVCASFSTILNIKDKFLTYNANLLLDVYVVEIVININNNNFHQ